MVTRAEIIHGCIIAGGCVLDIANKLWHQSFRNHLANGNGEQNKLILTDRIIIRNKVYIFAN